MGGDDYRPKRGLISRMPAWLKACAVKAWFSGMVFYFIGWGLFIQSSDQLDITLALGLALGVVTDVLINRALIYFGTDKENYRRFIFAYSKRFFSVPINLVYGIILSFAVAYVYHFINLAAQSVTGQPPETIFLGAEPILYGIFFMGLDMLCVLIKHILFPTWD